MQQPCVSALQSQGRGQMRGCHLWRQRKHKQQPNAAASSSKAPQTRLERIIRRKQADLKVLIDDMGMEALEEKLQGASASLSNDAVQTPVLIAEIARKSKDEAASELAERARILQKAGVHAVCVRTDAEDTATGLSDLFAVVRAVPKMPVLRRDWFIHPLQVIEALEAGAAGVLGIICQVNGQGTPVMTSFASAIGLDAPAEIVNQIELDFLASKGVPLVAINCGVGLSLAVPGVATDIAEGLLRSLPQDMVAVIGVTSVDEARSAAAGGAAALLVKADMLTDVCDDERACMDYVHALKYATSGDD